MFDAIKKFFENQNNYILFKVQNLADSEPVILRIENHWILKEEFLDDKSNDYIWKLFNSDPVSDYGRYVIYGIDS
jgi:hypothetical protein